MRSFGYPRGQISKPYRGRIAMYQELASTAFLHVAYRPDSSLLIGRWLCSITDAQLREGYETMRIAALEHRCNHWLMDARRRTDRRLNGPEWVVTDFLPCVQQEMNVPLAVAFLVLPNHLREVEADADHSKSSINPADLFHFARFIDEGAANAWLNKQRHVRGNLTPSPSPAERGA